MGFRWAKILLFAGLIFGVLLGFEALAGAQALALTRQAPVSPAPSPVPVAGLSANPSLTQQSAGTWTTTVELDTAAICPGPVTFDLVTTKPYTDTTDAVPTYRQGGGVVPVGGCRAIGTSPVTEVELTFTPSPALAAIPEAATLAVTPSAAALALGAAPLDITLAVHRQVSLWQYLGIPVGGGLLFALLLVGGTMVMGVNGPDGMAHAGNRFWRMPLYAAGAWSFGSSWATNIAALGAVIGAALGASASVASLLPGVEIGRFSLLLALAGGITVAAPLAFGVLNAAARRKDPAEGATPLPVGDVLVAEMRTMLAASCLTVFGIGAEIAIVGWVLGYNLVVAPQWARVCVVLFSALVTLLTLGYGVTGIRALADARSGTALSGARGSSFML